MKTLAKPSLAGFAAVVVLTAALGTPAQAAECTTDLDRFSVTQDQANELYSCIEAAMLEGYSKADLPSVPEYRNWKLVTTAPLVSATHGNMFVNHYVNDAGADLYTRWEDMAGEKFAIGTIFAKESFRISTKDGSVKRGALFLMEKVADDAAPDGWVYTRVFPNGKYQRTNGPKSEKMVFCHDCHAATLEEYDAAFFPPEEFRAK